MKSSLKEKTGPERGEFVGRDVYTIQPSRKWHFVDFRELWEYRELVYFLIWREVKVRYKQTLIGFAWAVIQPLFMMVIVTFVFGKLARVPSQGVPYPLFAYAALMPWTLFSESITRSTNSLIRDSSILRKVYFPRIVIPIAAVLSPLFDFIPSFSVFLILMACYGFDVFTRIIFLPFFIVMALLAAFSISLWLSALSVKYRDVQFVVPFVVQLWFFATPVAYPSSMVPERLQFLYGLNPMAGAVEGFRWALLGTAPPGKVICVSAAITVFLIITGIFYFRKSERTFADYV